MIRIAIVGCGSIGKRHAKWANKYGYLMAVCDIKKDRADKLAEDYDCRAYYTIEDLLGKEADIDFVAICTPNGLHSEHTYLALTNDCHVLCEKPMALTVADCELMINTAERMNKRLFVVKQNRFNPAVKVVKRAIDKGKLGEILSVHLSCMWNRNKGYYYNSDWKGSLDMDGGILYTQFSHFIDLLYYLIGDISIADTFSQNFIHRDTTNFPDTIVTAFKFNNGALGTAHFTINATDKNMEGALTIIGEKGTVKIGGQYLNTIEYVAGFTLPKLKVDGNCNDYGTYKGSSSKHDEVYKNIIGILSGKKGNVASMLDGMKTVQIIQKIWCYSLGVEK